MMKTTNLPNYLMVKQSLTYGLSLFATKNIPKGHVIATTDYTNMDYDDGCIGTPLGDLFNHSDREFNVGIKVNPKVNIKIDLISINEIKKGDELLINYEDSFITSTKSYWRSNDNLN